MKVISIKTRAVLPPKDDIYSILDKFCPKLKEKDIFIITSKILAIHQGRCIAIEKVKEKDDLIKKEAELFIPRKECPGEHAILTIKNHSLSPSAGIDESNSNGYYTFLPEEPEKEAKKICQYLKKRFSLKKMAVIITDSHCVPLRYGTVGISMGFYGLIPIKDYRGKKDIFGRVLEITRANIVDSLAVIGVMAMGEGNESRPMAIIRGADFVKFTNKETYKDLLIPIKEDIFYPLIKNFYLKYKK